MAKPTLHKFKSAVEKLAFEQFLENHAAHILQVAGLNNYILRHLQWYATLGKNVEMSVEVDLRYLDITINYSEDACAIDWNKPDYEDLLRVLCHEITHIITTEFIESVYIENDPKFVEHQEERLTEHVSRWLYAAYVAFMGDNDIDLKTGIPNEK